MGGEGMEIAAHPTTVHIRGSKNPQNPEPAVTPEAGAAFTAFATE
ncbi:DUF397 domain-containing protein [Streptomyces xanthochromogenes]